YYSSASNRNSEFKKRTLITSSGRHPQMAVSPEGMLGIVYEDIVNKASNSQKENHSHSSTKMDHSKMEMNDSMKGMNQAQIGKTQIKLHLLTKEKDKIINITDGQHAAHHAVIT